MAASPQSKLIKRWVRPHYSWSQYNCFTKQGWAEYARRYIYGDNPTNPAMELGKRVAEMIEHDEIQDDEILEHLRTFLPHSQHHEFKVEVPFAGITLLGFFDGFNEPRKCECSPTSAVLGCDFHSHPEPYGRIDEYKTGRLWTQEMADKTEQFDWYVLLTHLKYGIPPDKIPLDLVWMPTDWNGGNPEVTGDIQVFHTKRTMNDVLRIGKKIVDSYNKLGILVAQEYESIGI